MNEHTAEIDRTHNIVLVIVTIACFAAIVESIAQGWEFWVPPLIFLGVVASWFFHVIHYGKIRFRENFCIIMCMMVSFYHGAHKTSFFDVVVISMLLMVIITLLERKELLLLTLIEFFIIFIIQVVLAVRGKEIVFDALNISRMVLHILSEVCVYKALNALINKNQTNKALIGKLDEERKRIKKILRSSWETFIMI